MKGRVLSRKDGAAIHLGKEEGALPYSLLNFFFLLLLLLAESLLFAFHDEDSSEEVAMFALDFVSFPTGQFRVSFP